jgi:hypothetical protein
MPLFDAIMTFFPLIVRDSQLSSQVAITGLQFTSSQLLHKSSTMTCDV